MKAIEIGEVSRLSIVTDHSHTAAALGNVGADVVSTPHLISFLEKAANTLVRQRLDEGELSVGTKVCVDHLAAAPSGSTIEVEAKVAAMNGRRIDFAVELRWNGKLLMNGTHQRAVIAKDRLGGKP